MSAPASLYVGVAPVAVAASTDGLATSLGELANAARRHPWARLSVEVDGLAISLSALKPGA